MDEKRYRRHMLLTTIILLCVVFVMGLLLGASMSGDDIDDINSYIRDNELDIESFLIEQELMGSFEDNCDISSKRVDDLFSEQVEIGRLLSADDAEDELGRKNYDFLKRKYHLMQIRTYIMYKKLIDNCDYERTVILYYYGADDDASLEQGEILDRIVSEKDISVFALEYNYSEELNFLESSYSITSTPSIVIDYSDKYEGLTSYDEIMAEITGP